MENRVELIPLKNFPIIEAGDDLAHLVMEVSEQQHTPVENGDVIVLAQKIVSKAENRIRDLNEVTPSEEALKLSEEADKEARIVELILQESSRIVRAKKGLIIAEHKQGFISANAGIDQSNIQETDETETVLLLPEDCNLSAKRFRQKIKEISGLEVSVVINDSFGRPWRMGSCGVSLGSSGFPALKDMIGEKDLFGRELQVTEVAIADEIAAAASLVMGQASEGLPVVIIKGLDLEASEFHDSSDLIRDRKEDLFR